MRNLSNFLIGGGTTFGLAGSLPNIDPNDFGSLEELIRYLISILGGILAAILLAWLKKKFPEWFGSHKAKK